MFTALPLSPTRRRATHRAFTLLELIVVIVILGILAALAIPTFANVISNSEDTAEVTSTEAIMREAQAIYALDRGEDMDDWVAALEAALADMPTAAGVAAAGLPVTVVVDDPEAGLTAQRPTADSPEAPWTWRVASDGTYLGVASLMESGDRSLLCRTPFAGGGLVECWTGPKGEPSHAITANALAGPGSDEVGVAPEGPSAPQNLDATAANASATVTWDAPETDGSSAVVDYTVGVSPAGGVVSVDGNTATITGLTNGVTYTVTVAANNSEGPGAPASVTVVPFGDPDAVEDFAAASGDGQVIFTWTPKESGPGAPVDGYRIYTVDGEDRTLLTDVAGAASGTYTHTGLTNGTTYSFVIVAYAAVDGPESEIVSVTPAGAPAAPSAPSLTSGNGELAVSWTAPATNGAAITSYTVAYRAGTSGEFTEVAVAAPLTNRTLTGLTNGTSYQVTVSATNAAGTSAPSSVATATPATVPSAPTMTAAAGDRGFTASWAAPANGGSAITGYAVQYKFAAGSTWHTVNTSNLSQVVSGQAAGTALHVRVAAVNAVGQGAWSNQVTVTPWTSVFDFGQVLAADQTLTSPNGQYRLTMQASNNNLVVRRVADNFVVWAASNNGAVLSSGSNPRFGFLSNEGAGTLRVGIAVNGGCGGYEICWTNGTDAPYASRLTAQVRLTDTGTIQFWSGGVLRWTT